MSEFAKWECPHCGQPIEYPIEGVGTEIACPGCGVSITLPPILSDEEFEARLKELQDEHEARLAEIEREAELTLNPNLGTCKTCGGTVAISAEFCVHCGQKWPTLNITCGHCGSKDIEIVTVENTSSLFVTPSLAGVLAAALFEGMRPQPKVYAECQHCGYSLEMNR
jgi:DNA-directed RNA polymerase subunit RPC12/RpoP/RNase P subunit RPR2